MTIAAGALIALAFMALAGNAAAKETKIRCEGSGQCSFSASSGPTTFSITGGDTVKCEGMTGNGEVTSLNAERESTTGTVQLLLNGCKEQSTIFHFSCSNTATAGNVTTNTMIVHSVALPGTTNEAGTLITGLNTTFTCAGGFASTQITGNIIGEAESKCGTNTGATHKAILAVTGHGAQALTSYTGLTFRLEGETNHTGSGTYANAAQEGTSTFTFNQNTIVTCA